MLWDCKNKTAYPNQPVSCFRNRKLEFGLCILRVVGAAGYIYRTGEDEKVTIKFAMLGDKAREAGGSGLSLKTMMVAF